MRCRSTSRRRLRTQIKQRGENPDVEALLITGAGTAFWSGGDVKATGGSGLRGQMSFEERLTDLHGRVTARERPL